MIYGSICSGIEAASAAWRPLGWQCDFVAEIEPFCCSVLQERLPAAPNYGDITNFREWPDHEIDILIGGTPCQSYSIAGLRGGLADPRGNLMLCYAALAAKYRPRWLIWENVPGVLSSGEGRDFAALINALAECGYCCAWRVLDARHYGLPQMRRRVYLVAHIGDWRPAAAVLFDRASLRRDSGTGEKARTNIAAGIRGSPEIGYYRLRGFGNYTSDSCASTLQARDYRGAADLIVKQGVYCFNDQKRDGSGRQWNNGDFVYCLSTTKRAVIAEQRRVRRLTPLEYERLQGFPDNWTAIPGAKDADRYKALGNSMAVNVVRWLGERIAAINGRSAWTDGNA